MINLLERTRGCLIAAAYGDMLGTAVEFMNYQQIKKIHGSKGIIIPQPAFGYTRPVVSDDTQMTMATAQGLIEAPGLSADEIIQSVHAQYLIWLNSPENNRAPGNTCISALSSGRIGTLDNPINQSAGCGGIMRVHPLGIAFHHDYNTVFSLGQKIAAITHGHPNGNISAAFLSQLIAYLINGHDFQFSLDQTIKFLNQQQNIDTQGTHKAIESALTAPRSGDYGDIIDRQVGQTEMNSGGGWLGHDALAIAIYAVLCSPTNPLEAVRIAVNHSGDSDSTGSIAGAIMGAIYGYETFENYFCQQKINLEYHEQLIDLAEKLVNLT